MAVFNKHIDSTNGQFAVWGLGVWIPGIPLRMEITLKGQHPEKKLFWRLFRAVDSKKT